MKGCSACTMVSFTSEQNIPDLLSPTSLSFLHAGNQFGWVSCVGWNPYLHRVGKWAINGVSVSSFFIREIHFFSKAVIWESCQAARVLKKNTQNLANNVILSCGDLFLCVHFACCWLASSKIESTGSFAFGYFWPLRILVKTWFWIIVYWQHPKGKSTRFFCRLQLQLKSYRSSWESL